MSLPQNVINVTTVLLLSPLSSHPLFSGDNRSVISYMHTNQNNTRVAYNKMCGPKYCTANGVNYDNRVRTRHVTTLCHSRRSFFASALISPHVWNKTETVFCQTKQNTITAFQLF